MVKEQQHSAGHWEHFPHQVDIEIHDIWVTLEGAFAQTAVAMATVIICPRMVAAKETVTARPPIPIRLSHLRRRGLRPR